MRKILSFITLALFGAALFAQPTVKDIAINNNGIDRVIVEKLDVSGALGYAGMNRYRVFVDMEETAGLLYVTGDSYTSQMYFRTSGGTVGYYNTPIYGGVYGNSLGAFLFGISPELEYDSYLSAGARSMTEVAVPYSKNTAGFIAGTVYGTGGVGMAAAANSFGSANSTVNFESDLANGASYGPDLSALPAGSPGLQGPDTDNIVMIGQFTCDGEFEFNINVGTSAGTEVAIQYNSVEANEAPAAEIIDPANGANIFSNRMVEFTVSSSDPNTNPAFSQVTNVEYRVNGGAPVSIGASSTFMVNSGEPSSTLQLEVRATDNGGLTGDWSSVYSYNVVKEIISPSISSLDQDLATVLEGEVVTFTVVYDAGSTDNSPVIEWFVDNVSEQSSASAIFAWIADIVDPVVEVRVVVTTDEGTPAEASTTVKVISSSASYELGTIEEFCYESNTVCIPVTNIAAFANDVTGFDMDILYDATLLVPTGQVTVNVNPGGASMDNTEYHYNIVTPGVMHLSVALDNSSSVDDVWSGVNRELFCVQFAKTASWTSTSTTSIGAENIIESYRNSVSDPKVASAGTYSTIVDNNYMGFVKFWADFSGLYSADPYDLDIETFIGNAAGTYSVTTATDGSFAYDITNGAEITIEKDVAVSATEANLMTVYNGYDGYLTAQLLVNDARFQPAAIQMIAMDVNRDGVISAGDLSQINQRGTRMITYFRADGVTGGSDDVDWRFINEKQLIDDLGYRVSTTFPEDDGLGYSKYRVPSVPASFDLSASFGNDLSCPVIIDDKNTYFGILLGDVDGTYKNLAPEGRLKSLEVASVVFDLSDATYEEDFVDVPVKYMGEENVKSFSFGMDYNRAELTLQTIASLDSDVEALYNDDGDYLYLVSYSLESYNVKEAIFSIRFYAPNGINANDIMDATAFINGVKVSSNVTKSVENTTGIANIEKGMRIYPNPASEVLFLEVEEEVSLQIVDVQGRVVANRTNVIGKESIDIAGFSAGVYMLELSNDTQTVVKRIVVLK